MENLIWDGVPTQKKKKEDKFAFPVVTMMALDKPGAGRKFVFNKAAQELLNIEGEDRISFGFSHDRTIIAVRKAVDINSGIQLTKTCTISDKKTYEFIAKILSLNTTEENNFEIVSNEDLNTLKLFNEDLLVSEVLEEEEVIAESNSNEEEDLTVEEDFSDVEVNINDMPFTSDFILEEDADTDEASW